MIKLIINDWSFRYCKPERTRAMDGSDSVQGQAESRVERTAAGIGGMKGSLSTLFSDPCQTTADCIG